MGVGEERREPESGRSRTPRALTPPSARDLAVLAGVGLAYYLVAKASLQLALVGTNVTPLWPPTGIAVVALFSFGRRAWPAIAVAAFLVNVPIGGSVLDAAAVAAGNTLAPLLGAWLLGRVSFDERLGRRRDAVAIVACALVSVLVSATIGSVALVAADVVSSSDFWSSWSVWWAGDAMGVLAVAPFLWTVGQLRRRHPIDGWRVAEGVLSLAALTVVAWLALHSHGSWLFVVLPVVAWVAWRFQQAGAAPAALIVLTMAAWAAADAVGPFAGKPLPEMMLILQAFNASVALSSFFFAAVMTEQRRTAGALSQVAESLQRSFLPVELPRIDGARFAARYAVGSREVDVGGDWYDAFVAPDGRVLLVIGDVEGRGVEAAAAMSQLRNALRAYLFEGAGPAEALTRLTRLVHGAGEERLATVLCAEFSAAGGRLTYAGAGHPPALVVGPDGTTGFLEQAHSPPIGTLASEPLTEQHAVLAPGSTLVLYTDGLIERHDEAIEDGLRRLATAAAAVNRRPEALVAHLIDAMGAGERDDDVAVLAVQLESTRSQRYPQPSRSTEEAFGERES